MWKAANTAYWRGRLVRAHLMCVASKASVDRFQFRAERLVEAVGEVGGGDAERELHERVRSQLLLELFHEPRIDLDVLCHLLRIADHQSLEIGEERVGRVVAQSSELFLRHSVPLPEGRVVRHSIVATIDL